MSKDEPAVAPEEQKVEKESKKESSSSSSSSEEEIPWAPANPDVLDAPPDCCLRPVEVENPSDSLSEPDIINETELHANVKFPKEEWYGFWTPPPSGDDLDEETTQGVRDKIDALIKMKGGKGKNKIKKTHEDNLDEYLDVESTPYREYYMLLY